MINVLYVTFASDNFDGATYSLMDLIQSVRDHVYPIVMLRRKGCVYDYFREKGIECITCEFEENLVGIPRKPHQYIKFILKYIPHYIRYIRKNRKCVDYIYSVLKERDIKIVHTNNTVMAVGYGIARKLNARHVWHLRGFMDLDFGWMPLTGWKKMKEQIRASDAAIGITKSVLSHFISPDSPNAYAIFDAVRSKTDTVISFPKEKYFLFCAGLLSPKKGCDFAIRAFAHSGLSCNGYKLRIIGQCSKKYKSILDKQTINYKIKDAVDFIEYSENVKEHMAHAAAFLMCSENEGLGRVSIEAMFYGCLVIGRNSGGTKEFVLDNRTGYLFNTIEECASIMQKAVMSDNKQIILDAQNFACNNFSIEDYGAKIMKVYNNII